MILSEHQALNFTLSAAGHFCTLLRILPIVEPLALPGLLGALEQSSPEGSHSLLRQAVQLPICKTVLSTPILARGLALGSSSVLAVC